MFGVLQTLSDPSKRALYDALAGFGQGVNPFLDTAFPADQVRGPVADGRGGKQYGSGFRIRCLISHSRHPPQAAMAAPEALPAPSFCSPSTQISKS